MGSISIVPTDRKHLTWRTSTAEGVLLLPENPLYLSSDSEVVYPIATPTCETLLRQAGIAVSTVVPLGRRRYRDNRAADWIAPTIFLSVSALTQNPALLSIAYGVISNYLSTIFSHNPKTHVELSYLVESANELKQFSYKGPVKGLPTAKDIVRELGRDS